MDLSVIFLDEPNALIPSPPTVHFEDDKKPCNIIIIDMVIGIFFPAHRSALKGR